TQSLDCRVSKRMTWFASWVLMIFAKSFQRPKQGNSGLIGVPSSSSSVDTYPAMSNPSILRRWSQGSKDAHCDRLPTNKQRRRLAPLNTILESQAGREML